MSTPQIVYLTPPAQTSMADEWFELATPSHFWMRRRFEVLLAMLPRFPLDPSAILEVGCGNGVLRLQLETHLGVAVDGVDLNDRVLRHNAARGGNLYCYDINQRHLPFGSRYTTIFLFDVLEHINDEDSFLDAVLFHLAPDGVVWLNVPALRVLFSQYDVMAGHHRRYSGAGIVRLARRHHLEILDWTYWGFALVPLLLLRKMTVARLGGRAVRRGFDPRSGVLNDILLRLSRCEHIPQKTLGTSIIAALRRMA